MADPNSIASLVILTDSITELREYVNSGRVSKLAKTGSFSNCSSNYESSNSSPIERTSSKPESEEIVESVSSNSETRELLDVMTKNHLSSSSIETDRKMKLSSIADDINTSGDFASEHEPFENEQQTDSAEDCFASFRSNKSLPFKTYSKPQEGTSDKLFDCLKSDAENISDLTQSNERNYTENDLCSPNKRTTGSLHRKIKSKKSGGKENAKAQVENSKKTANLSTDSVDDHETGDKASFRKRFRTRKCKKFGISLSNKSLKQRTCETYECVKCRKPMRKRIFTSKYAFRSSCVKSRKCQNCTDRSYWIK